jgi:hypothetical protein
LPCLDDVDNNIFFSSELDQTCSNLFKLVQACFSRLKLRIIRVDFIQSFVI